MFLDLIRKFNQLFSILLYVCLILVVNHGILNVSLMDLGYDNVKIYCVSIFTFVINK